MGGGTERKKKGHPNCFTKGSDPGGGRKVFQAGLRLWTDKEFPVGCWIVRSTKTPEYEDNLGAGKKGVLTLGGKVPFEVVRWVRETTTGVGKPIKSKRLALTKDALRKSEKEPGRNRVGRRGETQLKVICRDGTPKKNGGYKEEVVSERKWAGFVKNPRWEEEKAQKEERPLYTKITAENKHLHVQLTQKNA